MAGYAPRLPWLLPLLHHAVPPPWARAACGTAGLRASLRSAGRCGALPRPPPPPRCRLLLPLGVAGSAPRALSVAAGPEPTPPPAPPQPQGAAAGPPRFEARRLLALARPERWRLTGTGRGPPAPRHGASAERGGAAGRFAERGPERGQPRAREQPEVGRGDLPGAPGGGLAGSAECV